ncbi:MAG: ParA family protein [Cyanobacteria bacterium J06638_22]
MHVLSFVTQKGGSGKTTLCTNLAVVAEQLGGRVLILDLDPQGTAEAWYQDRDATTPRLAHLTTTELASAIELARTQGFSHVLIDTPGRDEPSVAAAIRLSDFCLIPCRPTPADMKATPTTIGTVRRLEKPAAFVLMQTPPRGSRVKEAQMGLAVLGMVAPVPVVARNAFQDAQGAGLAVTEYDSEGKGAQEIAELWRWILGKLEKLDNEQKAHVA